MGYEVPVLDITLLAAADFSAKQFYLVKVDASGNAALCGAGEAGIGVIQNTPAISAATSVRTLGISKVIYGNTVTAGQQLMSDANGKAVPHTGTNEVVGVALESGAADEIHAVLVSVASAKGNSVSYGTFCIPIDNTKIADGDLVTSLVPGFAGTIEKLMYIVTDPVTTALKESTLNLEIGSTNVTGGVLSLASATMTPLGAVINATAITANNTFNATDAISIEASSTTAFIEGSGVLVIVYSA